MEPVPAYALDADGGERLVFGDVTILVRASAETTGGAFSLFEELPPMADTPLHVHEREDELFYVLEGEHVFQVGGQEFRAGPGGLVFAPRGVPHAQRRVVPTEATCSSSRPRRAWRASSASSRRQSRRGRSGRRHTRPRRRGIASPGSAEPRPLPPEGPVLLAPP